MLNYVGRRITNVCVRVHFSLLKLISRKLRSIELLLRTHNSRGPSLDHAMRVFPSARSAHPPLPFYYGGLVLSEDMAMHL